MVEIPTEHDIEFYPTDYLKNLKQIIERQIESKKRRIDKIDSEINRRRGNGEGEGDGD